LAHERQKRKGFLTDNRRELTDDRQNLSVPIQENQTVNRFLFLVLKSSHETDAGARPDSAGAGVAFPPSAFQDRPAVH
jgi:hypothetical protein